MRKSVYVILLSLLFILSAGCTSPETDVPKKEPIITPTPTPEGPYVAFSADSGFYQNSFELSLSCNVAGAEIYYTLDGSTPDKSSSLYTDTIDIRDKTKTRGKLNTQKNTSAGNSYLPRATEVPKGMVVRAVAYLPDGTATPVNYATYFVGIPRENYGEVPVISLITDFENLYDYETGIYVLGKTYDEWIAEDSSRAYLEGWQKVGNYTNSGREWERPVSLELLTADGSEGLKQNMGVRIMGGASRNQTQKSLKLIAREEYGKKSVKYELIPDNQRSDGTGLVTKYKSFVLRNGGNDADFGRVRDPLLQHLVKDCRFETQQATPCVVFINGEYWGMYSLTEDYSDNYFENNYNIDKDNVVLVKCGELEDGREEDLFLFQDMYQFITKNDMTETAFYDAACDMVDIGSLIDYFAFELYIANQDSAFDDNNWRMWRVRESNNQCDKADGKWRMVAYDSDFSCGIYDGGYSFGNDNFSPLLQEVSEKEREANLESYAPVELFRSLMKNSHFREELVIALCDMRNIYFQADHAVKALEEISSDYLRLMPDTFKRFGPDWIASQDTEKYFSGKIQELRYFLNGRYSAVPRLMKKAFGLSSLVDLTVTVSDSSMGDVKINNALWTGENTYRGTYFPELTLSLTALPAEGYHFAGWETDGNLIPDTSAATIEFKLKKNATLKAVFEKNR